MQKKSAKSNLVLSRAALRKLEKFAKYHRLTPAAALARIVDWIDRQPELVQVGVLGKFTKPVHDELTKLLLSSAFKTLPKRD